MENKMHRKMNRKVVVVLLIVAALVITFGSLFVLRGASFGGSDDAGSVMVKKITGGYKPWTEPVLEKAIGGEIPGEVESLLFCLQTAIGVGVIAFFMGRLVERRQWMQKEETKQKEAKEK